MICTLKQDNKHSPPFHIGVPPPLGEFPIHVIGKRNLKKLRLQQDLLEHVPLCDALPTEL